MRTYLFCVFSIFEVNECIVLYFFNPFNIAICTERCVNNFFGGFV